jgi:hypothetical protein
MRILHLLDQGFGIRPHAVFPIDASGGDSVVVPAATRHILTLFIVWDHCAA